MTEAEWLGASEGEIRQRVGALSPRRQRLLAVAACRVLGAWIDYPPAHAALEAAETYADTGKTKAALRRSRQALVVLRNQLYTTGPGRPQVDGGVEHALFGVQIAASENAVVGTVCHVIESLIIAHGIAEEDAPPEVAGLGPRPHRINSAPFVRCVMAHRHRDRHREANVRRRVTSAPCPSSRTHCKTQAAVATTSSPTAAVRGLTCGGAGSSIWWWARASTVLDRRPSKS